MIDNKTVHLNLSLPHEDNLLTEDVPRLREAFESLDAHAAQLETELSEALTAALAAATDAAKRALWAGIPDKPVSFPPANHNHSFAELGDKPAAFPPATHGHGWDEVSGKPGSFPPETHEHGWVEVTGKPPTFTPSNHSHPAADISGTLPTSKGGTGNTSGNAPTATRWQNSRTISLTGDASGSVSLNGANNVSLPVTIAAAAKGPMMPTAGTFGMGMKRRWALPVGGTWAWTAFPPIPVENGYMLPIYDSKYSSGVSPGGSSFQGNVNIVFYWRIA